jgi:hypothetical protein
MIQIKSIKLINNFIMKYINEKKVKYYKFIELNALTLYKMRVMFTLDMSKFLIHF